MHKLCASVPPPEWPQRCHGPLPVVNRRGWGGGKLAREEVDTAAVACVGSCPFRLGSPTPLLGLEWAKAVQKGWGLDVLLGEPGQFLFLRSVTPQNLRPLSHDQLARNPFAFWFCVTVQGGHFGHENGIIANCLIGPIRKPHFLASLDYRFLLTLPFQKQTSLLRLLIKVLNANPPRPPEYTHTSCDGCFSDVLSPTVFCKDLEMQKSYAAE